MPLLLCKKVRLSLLAGGTGNPFFTTDSASALRAVETGSDVLLKGTRVDGVYNADPEKNPSAVKYKTLSFDKALADNLKAMDLTAFALCKENKMLYSCFRYEWKRKSAKVIAGEEIGTIVKSE